MKALRAPFQRISKMSSETGQSLGSEGPKVKLKMDFSPKNLTVYGKRPICRQK